MLVLALAIAGFAQTHDPAAPGQMIDIGGRRLHLYCVGNGSPTVIVENGGGGFSVEWALMQPQIAKTTRICTYDRAGYAWSDRGPTFDAIEQIMDDAHLMLTKARVSPPYVFVGASLGALYSRAYQRRFPHEVAGLVFVDGSPEESITLVVDGHPQPLNHLLANEVEPAYNEYLRSAPKLEASRADAPPLDKLPPKNQEARHWALEKLIVEAGRFPSGLTVAESWRQEFVALHRLRVSSRHALGDLPLIAIERGVGRDEKLHAMQMQVAALSSRGKLITAEKSGHAIHLEQPEVVIQAIGEVVAACRARKR